MLAFEQHKPEITEINFSTFWLSVNAFSFFSYPSHSKFALVPRQILVESKGLQHSQVLTRDLEKSSLPPMVLSLELLHCTDVWRAQAHDTQGTLISNIIQTLAGMLLSSVLVTIIPM